MKIEFDTTKIKTTARRLVEQIEANPLAAAAIGAAVLNGGSAVLNATTKARNAKTARINAKAWETEVQRRDRRSI